MIDNKTNVRPSVGQVDELSNGRRYMEMSSRRGYSKSMYKELNKKISIICTNFKVKI